MYVYMSNGLQKLGRAIRREKGAKNTFDVMY